MVTPLDKRPRSGPYSGLNARSAKRFLFESFKEAKLPFAEEEALEIILNATGLSRATLILQGGDFLEPAIFEIIQSHMERRLSGEPLDHILGWREFYGRRFKISKAVLSPRADTEVLIRGALKRLSQPTSQEILDLGTGSGAIAITLCAECPNVSALATDLSSDALHIAKENAESVGVVDRLRFTKGEWWKAVSDGEHFDMILSNPPYISDQAMLGLESEVLLYDPDLALRGGADGMQAYRIIFSRAAAFLKPKGWLGVEIGFDQGEAVLSLLPETTFTQLSLEKDLAGRDRVIWAQKRH